MALIAGRQVRHQHGSEPIGANPCPLQPSRRPESGAGKPQKPYSVLSRQNPRYKVRNTSLECIPAAVEELLRKEGLRMEDIKVILPPQISTTFVPRLRETMAVSHARFVDLTRDHNDLYSSTLVYTLQHVKE